MKGSLTVKAGGDYAGGLVGEGSGTVIGDSSQNRLQKLTFWKYNNPRDFPQQRSTTIEGLESVTATLLRGWHRRQSATDNGSWVAQQCGENWRYRHAQEVRPVCRVHRGEHVCHRSGIRFDGDGWFILCGRCHRMRHRRRRGQHEPYQSGHGLGQGRSRRFYWLLWTRRRRWCRRAQCAWAYQAFRSAIGCPIFFGCSHCIECERHRQRIHGQGDRQEREQRDHRLRCGRFLWSGQQHQDPRKPCDEPQVGRGRYQHIRWHRGWFRGLLHHRRPRRRT